jgi:hypothetical protein
MRQDTHEINLEKPFEHVTKLVQETRIYSQLADLNGVEVYIRGVDAAGLSAKNRQRLQEFWKVYLASVNADLREYSISRRQL